MCIRDRICGCQRRRGNFVSGADRIQGCLLYTSHLAAAVSEAGGLGIIGAASAPVEIVQEEIRKAKELTDKPFGVNIMLLNPNAPEIARLVIEEKIAGVTTGAGTPEKYMDMWKEAGIKVIPVVASVATVSYTHLNHADCCDGEGTD